MAPDENTTNSTPPAADIPPVPQTKKAAADLTPKQVHALVNAGKPLPTGWAFSREKGFHQVKG